MHFSKKIMIRLIASFILLMLVVSPSVNAADDFIASIQEVVGPKMEGESGKVPFVSYISEGGLMAGEFFYDSNLFDNDADFTSVNLISPTTGIFTSFTQISNYPLSGKWKLGGNLSIIKYNEINVGGIGNNTPDQEISDETLDALHSFKKVDDQYDAAFTQKGNLTRRETIYAVVTGQMTKTDANKALGALGSDPLTSKEEVVIDTLQKNQDTLDGYQSYEGWNNRAAVNLTYELDQHNSIITEYAYEMLTNQESDYKSDTISLGWENKSLDNQKNPRQGHKIITKAKKSLNLLSHDKENDWNYTKLTFDARKYIPVFTNSTLALRFRTQSVSGDDVLDKERTALKKLYTGNPEAEVYTVAPFFDMSLLGNLNTMKGYRYYRFYDNHSALYQAEFRFPMDYLLSGLQGTLFAETGRVSNSFNSQLFTEDMHYSGGLGVKYYFNDDIIVRGDIGHSGEGTQIRMNIGQTF